MQKSFEVVARKDFFLVYDKFTKPGLYFSIENVVLLEPEITKLSASEKSDHFSG